MSFLTPSFVQRLSSDENIKTVMLCGCGGGFDFVHSVALIPELHRMGKRAVIASYSFGNPYEITGPDAQVVFSHPIDSSPPPKSSSSLPPLTTAPKRVIAKRVTAKCDASDHYCPEVAMCSFLDLKYPDEAPHHAYAFYARDFCVVSLSKLYRQIIEVEEVDAVILMDGGSDSLMRGNEAGLGDPIEDAVSVTTVAVGIDTTDFDPISCVDPSLDDHDEGEEEVVVVECCAAPSTSSSAHYHKNSKKKAELAKKKGREIRFKALLVMGVGCDRSNSVSDAATMRAVAELTRNSGFLGCTAVEPTSVTHQFYKGLVDHIYSRQSFRSVISGSILASAQGWFGSDKVPEWLQDRIKPGDLYIWPLMSFIWGFDVTKVYERSLMCKWVQSGRSPQECQLIAHYNRSKNTVLEVEEFPQQKCYF